MYVIGVFFFIVITNFVYEAHSGIYKYFTQKKVSQFVLAGGPGSANGLPFPYKHHTDEYRKQLCYYAKVKAKLLYIDTSYVPRWQVPRWQEYVTSSREERKKFGMYCPTLPTTYLLIESKNYEFVQIISLKSIIDEYIYDEEIIEADSVTLKEDQITEEFKASSLAKLNDEDRQNLCAVAREYVPLVFLDRNVAQARAYEFEYTNKKNTHFAVECPTSPKLYVRRGNSDHAVKLILFRDSIDNYDCGEEQIKPESVTPIPKAKSTEEFRQNNLTRLTLKDREKLCMICREHTSLPLKNEDVNVAEAKWYSFRYSGQEEKHYITVLCPAVPSIYLRLEDPHTKKIKFTGIQNPFDHYSYKIEFIKRIHPADSETKNKYGEEMEDHPFMIYSEEDRWNICDFAKNRVSHVTRLEILPGVVSRAQLFEFSMEYPRGPHLKCLVHYHVGIRCSVRPGMFVRVDDTSRSNGIKISFREEEIYRINKM